MFEKRELTTQDAIEDCKILNDLILSILEKGKVQDSGSEFPCEAAHERQRLIGVYKLMDKYCYGWYFTVDTQKGRVFTQDEQIQNVAQFQQYILSNIGKCIVEKDIA